MSEARPNAWVLQVRGGRPDVGRGQRVSQSPAVLAGSLSRQRQLLAPIRTLSREARAGWVNILGTVTFPPNKMPAYKEPGDLDFGAALMPSHKQGGTPAPKWG